MAILLQTQFPLSLPQPRYPFPFRNPNHSFLTIYSTTTKSLLRFNATLGFSARRNLTSPASPTAVDRQGCSETTPFKLPVAFVRLAVSVVLFFCFGIRACSASSVPTLTAGPSSVQEEQTTQGLELTEYYFL